jgi:hypothetical protein
MNKTIFTLAVSVFALIAINTSARAAELRFQCTDSTGVGFPITVDTATKDVTFGLGHHGQAAIQGTSISIVLDDGFSSRLDSRTGALTNAEGGGNCKRVK